MLYCGRHGCTRGPPRLVSPPLVSPCTLVPGTGHLCGVLLQCQGDSLHLPSPPCASGRHLPASGQPGQGYVSSVAVRVSTCVPCDRVGRRWFPKEGGVLSPGKGQAPGRQQHGTAGLKHRWVCREPAFPCQRHAFFYEFLDSEDLCIWRPGTECILI